MGVYDAKPEEIVQKGRLMPGKVLLVDTQLGKVTKLPTTDKELTKLWLLIKRLCEKLRIDG